MARPMGSVRLKKASPVTLLLGAVLCIFIIVFLSGSPKSTEPEQSYGSSHHLSPPTTPYQKRIKGVAKPPPVVHYNLNNVTSTADPIANRETVLILTPMAEFWQAYWDNLLNLNYPHDLITLGFILPKTKDGNAATVALQERIAVVQRSAKLRFKSVVILRQDFEPALPSQEETQRHALENQKVRRGSMAKARNSLLFTTLGPLTSWVLWLDGDVIETPPSLIQDLAAHDKPIIVPNCFQRFFDEDMNKWDERPYDLNNWQDSEIARQLGAKIGPDEILVEGYAEMATYRSLMAYLGTGDEDLHMEVPLDGVGGTALFVKADVHRDGAMFPTFPFYNLIETEGFAKMARRLGWQPYGLPNYKVYHE